MKYEVHRIFRFVQTVEVEASGPETALALAKPRFNDDEAPDLDVDSWQVVGGNGRPALEVWTR